MSRTETFSSARAVDVTTASDPVTIDTHDGADPRVVLAPEVPGDQHAEERIQAATVRLSGTTIVVDVPATAGGRGGSGVFIGGTNHGTVVQSGGVTVVNGRVVSGDVHGIQAGYSSGTNVVYGNGNVVSGGNIHLGGGSSRGGLSITGDGNTVSHVSGTVYSRGSARFGSVTAVGQGGIRVMVTLPRRADITARTISGSVTQRGTAGTVRIETTSGMVLVESATGRADIHTTSGRISADVSGGGHIESVSGQVMVTATGQPVSVETVSGAITRGGDVSLIHCETVSGRIR
mgnify:CR=1 FL=1